MTRRGAGVVALAALLAPLLIAGPATAAPRATGAPVTVSVVVPITAPETDGVLLDAETLVVATSPSGTLTRDLDAVLATSATIALDPRIPVSIRALGTAAPESATEWLTRLEAAPNDVFLLAYADADLSALARADALEVAANLDVAFALDAGDFGPPQTSTPTAIELEVDEIGPSLRYATAQVTRASGGGGGSRGQVSSGAEEPWAASAPSNGGSDDVWNTPGNYNDETPF